MSSLAAATVRVLLLTTGALWLAACSPISIINALTPGSGYSVYKDLRYAPGDRRRLDVYVPENVASAPVVLYFYGGRWQTGSKNQYLFIGQALASRGIVAVIADYRIYPDVRFPAFVEDGAAALAWVRDNIADYAGDAARIFVAGHSAGAHIAAMLNLDERYLESVGGDRSWLAGMIGLAGPYDFLPLTDADLQDMFGPPERYPQSQPINFVDGDEPPMLLLHGLRDETVLPRNTRNLARAIRDSNGVVRTIYYDKMEHMRIVGALAAPLRRLGPVLADISGFVHDHARAAAR